MKSALAVCAIPKAITMPLAIRPEDLPHYTYDDYRHWEGDWEQKTVLDFFFIFHQHFPL